MLPALFDEGASIARASRVRDRLGMGLLVALCTVGLAACGGGERQDADESEGEFPVAINSAEFPAKQRLAQTSDLVLEVSNPGDETIPDLVVTVFTDAVTAVEVAPDDAAESTVEGSSGEGAVSEQSLPEAKGAFSVLSRQQGLAIPSRPVWILEQGYPKLESDELATSAPGEITGGSGAEAAQTNSFSFGALEPDDSLTLVWKLTPVQAGAYTVHYRLAAGLQGNAVAVNADGGVSEGEFVVAIDGSPPQTRVDDGGEVVPIKPDDLTGQ
ncbi:MAG: hypothetical protein M3O25_00440 [Actinomycetota bacterium]|nr:hypothetical protein [Actinomycetota bacterium]